PIIAWASTAWLAYLYAPALARRARGRAQASDDRRLSVLSRRTARARRFVAALALATFAAVAVALAAARTYHADHLAVLIADWLARPRVPVQFDTVEKPDGLSLVRLRSPLPTSTGGVLHPDEPATDRMQMAVVAAELDGARCGGRLLSVTSAGFS